MMSTVAAAGAVAGLAHAVPVPARAPHCDDHAAVRQALERLTRVHRLTGAAVRIDDPRCGTWSGTSGTADRHTGRPMRADERVRIGSITKTFTAVVVLDLVAEGRLSLDDTVDRHLPGLIDRNGYDGRTITVRSLLQHTSGLPDHTELFPDADTYRFRHFEPEELVEMALDMPSPGPGWHYSTTGYVIAGLIVEKVTGRSLEAEVHRRIIRPLGLRDTYWPGDETGIRGPHPRGYVRQERDGTVRWVDHTERNMSMGGAGGALISSPRDVNVFFGALLGGRLLPPAQLAEMKDVIAADPDRAWEGAEYGLGLMRTVLPCGVEWWGHAGTIYGYSTIAGTSPAGRRVAVSLNENPENAQAFGDYLNVVQTALCGRPGTE